MKYAIYNKTTGEIVWVMVGSENDMLFTLKNVFNMSEHSYVEADADPDLHYVDTETEQLRNRVPFELVIDGNIVSGIPEGTRIRYMHDRSRDTMDASGVLELEVDHPQVFEIQLDHPHHTPCTIIKVDLT